MAGFTLHLHDANRAEHIAGVTSFVGEDASGCFGLQPGHQRFITALGVGLARFRLGDASWRYLAVPGAMLYFNANQLTISTRHYLLDEDYARISQLLQDQLLAEERDLHATKASLQHMEQEMFRRLWAIM